MRKRRLAALAAVLLLLASCGRAEKGAVPQDAYPETDAAPGVTVSRFKTFGLVNGAVYGKFEKPEEIRAFEDAVDTAERLPGILNVAFAGYDVVIGADGKVRGDAWKRFADNVKGHAPDEVHITAYTVEGAPIFYDLSYDGESNEYRFDNTRDAFGSAARSNIAAAWRNGRPNGEPNTV